MMRDHPRRFVHVGRPLILHLAELGHVRQQVLIELVGVDGVGNVKPPLIGQLVNQYRNLKSFLNVSSRVC